MDEEKLICLVQKYKEIYDFSDNAYHNQQQKDNVWEEIAEELNKSGKYLYLFINFVIYLYNVSQDCEVPSGKLSYL